MSVRKIIIFRTIASTSMVFVINDVVKKFGPGIEITVITRQENSSVMKEISYVNDVLCFSGHEFNVKYSRSDEIGLLIKQQYDMAIVPTDGAIESYDNVIKFIHKIYGRIPINYWVYPNKFIRYKPVLSQELFKRIAMFLSAIITGFVFLPYLTAILYYSYRNKNIDKFLGNIYEY